MNLEPYKSSRFYAKGELEPALFYALASPFIGEEEAQGYMVPRANMRDDIGVDTDQVEVPVEA